MNESNPPEFTFTDVSVVDAQMVHVAAVADELAEQDIDHGFIFRRAGANWSKKSIPHTVVGMCVVREPNPKALNVCATGEVVIATLPGFAEEKVDASEEGPSHLVPLRAARSVGQTAYVFGMARRVYRRTAPNQWTAIDAGVFAPRNQRRQGVGFLSLDGPSPDEVYASGYKGEIWFYDGKVWTPEQSPTNVALTALKSASDGFVYVAGLAGVIIRGRHGEWEVIQQELTRDDFWGGAIFKDIPYFATNQGIYHVTANALEQVDTRSLGPISTAKLDANDEVLWSAGAKDIAFTRDGINWESVPVPT